MRNFISSMKVAFELHNNNEKLHPVLSKCNNVEDLEDFVRKNEKSPKFLSLLPAINAAIKIEV